MKSFQDITNEATKPIHWSERLAVAGLEAEKLSPSGKNIYHAVKTVQSKYKLSDTESEFIYDKLFSKLKK
jgi:hypothetical protein